jgi:hypothetical protein
MFRFFNLLLFGLALFALFTFFGCGWNMGAVHTRESVGIPDGSGTTGPTIDATSVSLNLPARFQWEANGGYCGEMSFVIAGMYYGQYLSQYDARALASPGVKQSRSASQLLLDVNEGVAATAMKLNYQIWPKAGDTNAFLLWTKNHLLNNHVVIAGVFENTDIFQFQASPGDDYDHIVPITRYISAKPIANQQIYPGDQIVFTDNGDFDQSVISYPSISNYPYPSSLTYSYAISNFVFTRQQQPFQPYYLNNGEDSAIAILGVQDPNGETLPVQLQTNAISEAPEMIDGSSARPAASPLSLTITVSGLKPGVAYNLYKYTNFNAVPTANFNANAAKAAAVTAINISAGSTFVTLETIMSNEMAIYRAVPASGP